MTRMFGKSSWHQHSAWDESESISSEMFGLERLRQHARSLAEAQVVTASPPRVSSIIDRLQSNTKALRSAYQDTCMAVAQGKAVTPAAQWLIDNYHLVEEQMRQTSADLPPGFYRQLPKLANGTLAGLPRIFGLVWAYVAHNDSQFDPISLADFVNEYQKVQPLTIGELWAVSISLRLILIENLRRISQRIVSSLRDREAADRITDTFLNLDPASRNFREILDRAGEPTVTPQFAVQFIQRMRDQGDSAGEALTWLRQKLEQLGHSPESAVSDEHHRQIAANVTVRNIVTSMRLIADVNWETWFDSVSMVDRLLRTASHV